MSTRYVAVICFTVLALTLSWLLALPLWLGKGLAHRLFVPITLLIMWTPALAALVTSWLAAPTVPLARSLGLERAAPFAQTARYCLRAMFLAFLLSAAALVLGHLLGVYRFDLRHFSAFEQTLRQSAAANPEMLSRLPPVPVLIGAQLFMLIPGSLINAIPALGEEIGWRGWLLPQLLPLGTFRAILVSGVIWGVWHAPLVLLGYNYADTPAWLAMLCMIGFCTIAGSLLSWLRLRTGSVWVCAIAHGAINACGGLAVLLGEAGDRIDTTQATMLGWTGWILPGLLAWALYRSRRLDHGPTAHL